jgi:folylpolyglutamate synthase/dihydropteroate synthase
VVERKLAQVDKQLQAQNIEMLQDLVEPVDEEIEEATISGRLSLVRRKGRFEAPNRR